MNCTICGAANPGFCARCEIPYCARCGPPCPSCKGTTRIADEQTLENDRTLRVRTEAFKDEQRRALEDAIANAPSDKEPFDVYVLAELYDLNGNSLSPVRGDYPHEVLAKYPQIVEEIAHRYYVGSPELRTMKELAEKLKWFDAWDCN